jgi:hypothetical protein
MNEQMIKKALQSLPPNGDPVEIRLSNYNCENSIYIYLLVLEYVLTTKTKEEGVIAVAITDLGKMKLATL